MPKNGLNIIFITADSLRPDSIGYMGGGGSYTPNIDSFAASSVVFRSAIAQGPYTTVSVPSILTGKYPNRLPMTSGKLYGHLIPKGDSKIAKWLSAAGYNTGAFHSNPLLSNIFNYHRGFDTFYDDLFLQNTPIIKPIKWFVNRLRRLVRPYPYLPGDKLNKKALAWLKKNPFPALLWLHYMDTHGPYQPHTNFAYLSRFKSERLWHKAINRPHLIAEDEKRELFENYKREVIYLDKQIGDFFDYLKKMELFESSLIIFTSDHGEGFGEHGFFSHPHHLYEELIRTPLIIKAPQVEPKIVDKPVPLASIIPTILDFADVEPKGETLDGLSLRPLLEGKDEKYLPDYVISEAEFYPYVGAIRTTEWKLIINEKYKKKELYNLKEDPDEKINLYQDNKELGKKLENILMNNNTKGRNQDRTTEHEPVLDSEVKKRLKDLGYY